MIAPFADRTQVAAVALRALVERGARIVMATYEGHKAPQPRDVLASLPGLQAASRQRHVERSMKLQSSFEATLAQMGKHTRSNLRYYRRRLEKLMPLKFIADVGPLLAAVDLQRINGGALNPVAPGGVSSPGKQRHKAAGQFSLRSPGAGRAMAEPDRRLAAGRHHRAALADEHGRL